VGYFERSADLSSLKPGDQFIFDSDRVHEMPAIWAVVGIESAGPVITAKVVQRGPSHGLKTWHAQGHEERFEPGREPLMVLTK
jgi:hypothetical protein